VGALADKRTSRRLGVVGAIGALFLVAWASQAGAAIVTFKPKDADLGDLVHARYLSWGFTYQLPEDERYVDVALKISKIDNWRDEPNHLYIHLLDNPAAGIQSWTDNQGQGDAWAGVGPLVADYVDYNSGHSENLSYSLASLGLLDDFALFASTGRVGFGFDPDCHYYNCGISAVIETEPNFVPEPATMALLALGGVGMLLRRRRNQPLSHN
jgi:hypothetical protein